MGESESLAKMGYGTTHTVVERGRNFRSETETVSCFINNSPFATSESDKKKQFSP